MIKESDLTEQEEKIIKAHRKTLMSARLQIDGELALIKILTLWVSNQHQNGRTDLIFDLYAFMKWSFDNMIFDDAGTAGATLAAITNIYKAAVNANIRLSQSQVTTIDKLFSSEAIDQ